MSAIKLDFPYILNKKSGYYVKFLFIMEVGNDSNQNFGELFCCKVDLGRFANVNKHNLKICINDQS